MKRIVAIFITVLFFAISIFATEVNIKGSIVDSNGTLFKITITPIDTTKIAINVAMYKKEFEIPVTFIGDAVIEVKSDNNESYSSTITILTTGNDLGEIKLHKTGVELKEVTVTGRKMQIERDGLNYIIRNIQGTHIGDSGNLMDMLKWTPGVIVRMDDDISVIGKGSPAIYINDRKIMDKSELLSLQSSEVSRIEVIREPGVRYSTGTSSVIHIYLRKPLKDYIGALLSNNTNIYRKVSNTTSLNLNGKFGIVSATASFRYSRANGLAYDHSGTTITHSENNIFPNVRVSYMPKKGKVFAFSYRRIIGRPSFG